MTGQELVSLFDQACRRSHVTGTKENGVIVALDLVSQVQALVGSTILGFDCITGICLYSVFRTVGQYNQTGHETVSGFFASHVPFAPSRRDVTCYVST